MTSVGLGCADPLAGLRPLFALRHDCFAILCHDEISCVIRRVFITVRERTTDVLNGISLAQGARWEVRTAADAEPEWESIANWQI